jgi:hypothetical protein
LFLVIILLTVAGPVFSLGVHNQQRSVASEKKSKQSFITIQTEVLDGMVNAYTGKNARQFMSFVAEDYAGDDTLLDRRIRRDFSKFVDMDIRYTFNNVTTDSRNENISAAVTFTRSYTAVKTSKRINKTGSAVFIFRMVDGNPKLFDMKRSSMFGMLFWGRTKLSIWIFI